MKFFDGRKWSERRIAFWGVAFSLVSIVISTCTSIKTNQISQGSFCLDKVSARLDDLNSHLHEIPKLVSGCSVQPKTYCTTARASVATTRNISFQMGGLLSDTSPHRSQIDDLTTLLNETEETLKATDGSNGPALVKRGHQITLKLREIAQINSKKLACVDLSE